FGGDDRAHNGRVGLEQSTLARNGDGFSDTTNLHRDVKACTLVHFESDIWLNERLEAVRFHTQLVRPDGHARKRIDSVFVRDGGPVYTAVHILRGHTGSDDRAA